MPDRRVTFDPHHQLWTHPRSTSRSRIIHRTQSSGPDGGTQYRSTIFPVSRTRRKSPDFCYSARPGARVPRRIGHHGRGPIGHYPAEGYTRTTDAKPLPTHTSRMMPKIRQLQPRSRLMPALIPCWSGRVVAAVASGLVTFRPSLDQRVRLCYARWHIPIATPPLVAVLNGEHEHARLRSLSTAAPRSTTSSSYARDRRQPRPRHRLPPDQR